VESEDTPKINVGAWGAAPPKKVAAKPAKVAKSGKGNKRHG
jgi:hypothetical protein